MELLDNLEEIKKIDKSGMLAVVEKTAELLAEAQKISARGEGRGRKKISNITIAGMGGSAIAGDIVAGMLRGKAAVPFFINRNYSIPAYITKESVFIAISYSGETEETLSALKKAEEAKAFIICICSGGKLREIAEKKGYIHYLVPTGYQPRAAFPFLLVALLKSLAGLSVAPYLVEEVDVAISLLRKMRGELGMDNPARSNLLKQLARKLVDKTLLIFASTGTTEAAGYRLKTQLNENSKMTAHLSIFPELDHNEIVNLSILKRDEHNFSLVVLRDDQDPEKIKKRIEITKSLIGAQLGGVNEIQARGETKLGKILSLIFIGDYLSVYLALLRGIDPTPVEVIAKLKKELVR